MLSVTVTGNLGQDSELKYTPSGEPILSFSVASTDKQKGEKVTTWVRCSLFGKRGTALAQYLTKGTRVCVVGTLHPREYTSQGEKKTSLDVKVGEIDMMGGGERQEARPATTPETAKWTPPRQASLDQADDGEIPF
jgi:single-strand DNA-binding protein